MKQNISVVIPCKDDPLVVRCVNSIDENCEIIIVFNGSPQKFINAIKQQLKNREVRYVELDLPNLSWALESGTRAANNDLILYMDSDCIFQEKAIEAFIQVSKQGNPSNQVFKGDVVFADSNNFVEKIIAKSRTHHTAEVLTAYKPPLLISKQIVSKIGGYAFDYRLIWREDSDLDNRIREAGVEIVSVPNGKIFHKSISLKTDLRSTFRYGTGLAIANALNIKLTEVPRSTLSTLRSQGILPALYMVFRNRIYDFGYWYTTIRIRIGAYFLEGKPNK